jgi:tetratricopeptide (TPR) repeat protein
MAYFQSKRQLEMRAPGAMSRPVRRLPPNHYAASASRAVLVQGSYETERRPRHTATGRALPLVGLVWRLLSRSPAFIGKLIAAAGLALFLVTLTGAVRSKVLVVAPVAVPESLAKRGYSPQYVAERIAARMNEIGLSAQSAPHDSEMTVTDTAAPDIQVPEVGMSLESAVYYLKKLVGQDDEMKATIGISEAQSGGALVAQVRLHGGPVGRNHDTVRAAPAEELNDFVNRIGDVAMRLAEPTVLASYLLTKEQATGCSPKDCRFTEARQVYEEMLSGASPVRREWAWAGKVHILLLQDDAKHAEALAKKALEAYPDFGLLHTELAVALEREHRCDDALAEVGGRDARNPPYTSERLRLWGDVLLHADLDEQAVQKFSEAAGLNPELAQNFHDWGEALLKLGLYDEAIGKLSHAVALDPNFSAAYVEWGRVLEAKGDFAGAIRKYEEGVDADINNAWAHKYLSDALRKTGRAGRADVFPDSAPKMLNADLIRLPMLAQTCPKREGDERAAAAEMQKISSIAVMP